ncbi:MAG TPA: hypothetical protein VFE51_10510 [Verrucomicrobiae bacterium]|nr:hypothetical protein [Verrucomicrobiae bacterium]
MNEKRELLEEEANRASEHKAVLVETEGIQCMAYQDCYGKWRRFYDLEPLPGKVEVVTSD